MEKWFWLPDWASDLSLWEDDLTAVEPDAEHVFVPYNDMAGHLEKKTYISFCKINNS